MNTYADMSPGEVAENFAANLEDTLFKLKCQLGTIRDERYVFDVVTIALTSLLGEHLAEEKGAETTEYMDKVHQRLFGKVEVPKPVLTVVKP